MPHGCSVSTQDSGLWSSDRGGGRRPAPKRLCQRPVIEDLSEPALLQDADVDLLDGVADHRRFMELTFQGLETAGMEAVAMEAVQALGTRSRTLFLANSLWFPVCAARYATCEIPPREWLGSQELLTCPEEVQYGITHDLVHPQEATSHLADHQHSSLNQSAIAASGRKLWFGHILKSRLQTSCASACGSPHGSVNLSVRIFSLSLVEICQYSFHCQCVTQNMFKMIV